MDLEPKAVAIALEAVARGDAAPVERRAVPAREAAVEWNQIHLRSIREQAIAVYDPVGEIEIVLDARGKLCALDDPRHAPTGREVHVAEAEAIAAVARVMGMLPKDVELAADFMRTRDGAAFLRVKNRPPREMHKSKFFQPPPDEGPKPPPPDRIEADVNAATGQIFRFRREPPEPPEPRASAEAKP